MSKRRKYQSGRLSAETGSEVVSEPVLVAELPKWVCWVKHVEKAVIEAESKEEAIEKYKALRSITRSVHDFRAVPIERYDGRCWT